jgi:hypothetical protein
MKSFDFPMYLALAATLGSGVDSASMGNECQECSWGGKMRPARKGNNLTAIC